jgi:hypothetical protein
MLTYGNDHDGCTIFSHWVFYNMHTLDEATLAGDNSIGRSNRLSCKTRHFLHDVFILAQYSA